MSAIIDKAKELEITDKKPIEPSPSLTQKEARDKILKIDRGEISDPLTLELLKAANISPPPSILPNPEYQPRAVSSTRLTSELMMETDFKVKAEGLAVSNTHTSATFGCPNDGGHVDDPLYESVDRANAFFQGAIKDKAAHQKCIEFNKSLQSSSPLPFVEPRPEPLNTLSKPVIEPVFPVPIQSSSPAPIVFSGRTPTISALPSPVAPIVVTVTSATQAASVINPTAARTTVQTLSITQPTPVAPVKAAIPTPPRPAAAPAPTHSRANVIFTPYAQGFRGNTARTIVFGGRGRFR